MTITSFCIVLSSSSFSTPISAVTDCQVPYAAVTACAPSSMALKPAVFFDALSMLWLTSS
ncbi:hypothetical protein [Bacteroides fragilis]|uniref:hypothetical protein n=1 Tax=Bacteroides fragilis TaxID=817 RepID=UPI0012D2E123|nr:hypothetical protein [Bacteroides fragilis]